MVDIEHASRMAPGLTREVEPSARNLWSMLDRSGVNCVLVLPDGGPHQVGAGAPAFTVTFKTQEALRRPLTEYHLGTSYIKGDIDLEGDMRAVMAIRDHVPFGTTMAQKLCFLYELFLRSPTKMNKRSIDSHYTLGDDFYLSFIDERYRFYSHCLFQDDDEPLEVAAEHKLESMWSALGLEPGMRLLDVGGGWGGVAEYCSPRGVHVTSLTVVEDSAAYIRRLIGEKELSADVRLQDILDFETDKPFDHVVIYGVIEHIPNYARLFRRVWDALRPGGRLYFDASAAKEKFAISPITRKYTWQGHHSFLSLQDALRELLFHGFEIVEVARETRDYELTITHWAERFERSRDEIVRRWGEEIYREYRIFLWGGSHAFATNRLQAYHVVAERRHDPGPRPRASRRLASFLGSLTD